MNKKHRWMGWLLSLVCFALLLGCSANDEAEGETTAAGEDVEATAVNDREQEFVPSAVNVERFKHSEPEMLMSQGSIMGISLTRKLC